MNCPSCQEAVTEADSAFCEACGARLERTCESCGATSKPQARFCRGCGSPFEVGSDAEPERPFRAEGCNLIVMRGHRGNVSLSRDVASGKRLFSRRSFWDLLVPALGALSPSYQRYSYSERADVFQVRLSLESVEEMLGHAKLLKYSSIIEQLSYLDATSAELFVER